MRSRSKSKFNQDLNTGPKVISTLAIQPLDTSKDNINRRFVNSNCKGTSQTDTCQVIYGVLFLHLSMRIAKLIF